MATKAPKGPKAPTKAAKEPKAPTADGRMPFYPTITKVRESFVNAAGQEASVDLPLVTLPPGTLLFRTIKLANPTYGDDPRNFYRDYLGSAEPNNMMCMSPIHNTFFYPFPYVGFGIHTVGKSFNAIQLSVLVHPVNVVACVSPSSFVRGMGHRYSGTAPWVRCGQFGTGPPMQCHHLDFREIGALEYDNCLNPDYQARSGTRGWMAIADLDSINSRKKTYGATKPPPMKETAMGSYIRNLALNRKTTQVNELLLNLYTDDHNHAGYPEIVLYPYKNHPGPKTIVRRVASEEDAINQIEKEASANNLNFLPIATITRLGVTDMVNGHFTVSRAKAVEAQNLSYYTPSMNEEDYVPKDPARRLEEFMEKLKTEGLDLPFYGKSKLSLDTRTGFYVFPEMIPTNLRIKVPEAILQEEAGEATPGNAERKAYEHELYRYLTLPMSTPEERARALSYQLRFRAYLEPQFMKRYPLGPGFAKRRAMIFNRYPVLRDISTGLEIPLPPEWARDLAQAGKLYIKETGKKPKSKAKPLEGTEGDAAAGGAAALVNAEGHTPPGSPAYAPATPLFGANAGYLPTSPMYGAATPPLAPAGEAGGAPRSPLYGAATPPLPPAAGEGPPPGESTTPVAGSAYLPGARPPPL
jgi:hypothetical protein